MATNQKETVGDGDTVAVHYTGKLDSGDVFDSSDGGDPLEFKVGEGQVIPGFDKAVRGLSVGEKRTVRIPPEEAYGERRDDLVMQLDRALFEGDDLEVGQHLDLEDEAGEHYHADVLAFDESTVTVDLNHHLAGEALNFDITVVGVR